MILMIGSERGGDVFPSLAYSKNLTYAKISKYLWRTIFGRKMKLSLKGQILATVAGFQISVLYDLSGNIKNIVYKYLKN